MNLSKKILTVLAAVFCLASCGNSAEGSLSSADTASSAAETAAAAETTATAAETTAAAESEAVKEEETIDSKAEEEENGSSGIVISEKSRIKDGVYQGEGFSFPADENEWQCLEGAGTPYALTYKDKKCIVAMQIVETDDLVSETSKSASDELAKQEGLLENGNKQVEEKEIELGGKNAYKTVFLRTDDIMMTHVIQVDGNKLTYITFMRKSGDDEEVSPAFEAILSGFKFD